MSRVPAAKAGPPANQLTVYDAQPQCKGIMYLPNGQLGNAANRVLNLAERLRSNIHDRARDGGAYSRNNESEQSSFCEQLNQTPRSSSNRRASILAGDDTQESLLAEIDRARSRLQTGIMEKTGHSSHDLWRTALRMLPLSRVIQPQLPKIAAPVASTAPAQKPKQLVVRTLEIPASTPRKGNPWGIPLAPKTANATMSPRPKPRKNSLSASAQPSGQTFLPKQTSSPQAPRTKEYKSNLPCAFSEEVWWRVLGYAVGADGILSKGQQRSVLLYGMDKETLRKEREALGQKESLQIWHVLDIMDCLAYEVR